MKSLDSLLPQTEKPKACPRGRTVAENCEHRRQGFACSVSASPTEQNACTPGMRSILRAKVNLSKINP